MTKAEMPVQAISQPLTRPASQRRCRAPRRRRAAPAGPRPASCRRSRSRPARRWRRPARFIWPMAMMIICDMRDHRVDRDRPSSRTWMLNGDRKDGSSVPMTTIAQQRRSASGPNQSVRSARAQARSMLRPSAAGPGSDAAQLVDQHGREQQAGRGRPAPRTRRSRSSSRPLVSMADQHGAEQRAEHRDAPAASAACRRAPAPRKAGSSQSCPRCPAMDGMAAPCARHHHQRGDARRGRPTACGR